MLDSLYVYNFRIFDELKVERLGKVNLIVGKNNSGKSCLLEALLVYARNASPALLYDLVKQRGEDWEVETPKDDLLMREIENPIRYLFHGYHFPDFGDTLLEIGPLDNERDRIKLYIRPYQYIETEDGHRRGVLVDQQDMPDDLEEVERVIALEQNGESRRLIPLDRDFVQRSATITRYRPLQSISDTSAKLNVQFVPTRHISSEQVGVLWDEINTRPPLRQEVFKGLQLIDNDIREVVLIGRGGNRNFPILLYENGNRLPMGSLGDGTIHLFHIILALVNARDGFLLIDEFENGLHYLVQPKVWHLIFELADTLNVQVFATTHSWDCVRGFQEATRQHDTEAMLIHLGHSVLKDEQGRIVATTYDNEELQLATRAGLELR